MVDPSAACVANMGGTLAKGAAMMGLECRLSLGHELLTCVFAHAQAGIALHRQKFIQQAKGTGSASTHACSTPTPFCLLTIRDGFKYQPQCTRIYL